MALLKAIRQDDGIITNYHRILSIQQTVNRRNRIDVLSYVDRQARESETDNEEQPYSRSSIYTTAYCEGMTPEKAYEYLKTLPDFEGTEDI